MFKVNNNDTRTTSDHVFYTNIIAYCQQNRYVQAAIYIDLFILSKKKVINPLVLDVH